MKDKIIDIKPEVLIIQIIRYHNIEDEYYDGLFRDDANDYNCLDFILKTYLFCEKEKRLIEREKERLFKKSKGDKNES